MLSKWKQIKKAALSSVKHPDFKRFVKQAVDKAEQGDWVDLNYALNLKDWPVGVEEFICSKEYMKSQDLVYPKVLTEIIEVNSGKYVEALFTGGIGSGKTTAALYTNAYQLYLLSMLRDPHKQYGLDPASEILFIFQNATDTLAKSVDFARFKGMLARSPYFTHKYTWRQDIDSKMIFPQRVEVIPMGGSATKALGQNVMGGLIDELNYMVRIEKSKRAMDGEDYDQAVTMYNSLARRRKSRFIQRGRLPGILCLVSSRRYPGEFTDVKEAEALTDDTIYVYDKRVWEIKPEGTFTGEVFRVYVGDETEDPEICTTGEEYLEEHVIEVPVEYKAEFEADLLDALREIAGVAKASKALFFRNRSMLHGSFGLVENIFWPDSVDFDQTELQIFPSCFISPERDYAAHIDLAISGDSAGIAVGSISGFCHDQGMGATEEKLPIFEICGTLRVMPPKGGQIIIAKIRKILYTLTQLGMNLRWISFDTFQSYDSTQILRGRGYSTGFVSVDKTPIPYHLFRGAVNGGRMRLTDHEHLLEECSALLEDRKKGKVDHPATGSKDVADAVAGLCYLLYTRREIWLNHGVMPVQLPDAGTIREQLAKKEEDANRTHWREGLTGT